MQLRFATLLGALTAFTLVTACGPVAEEPDDNKAEDTKKPARFLIHSGVDVQNVRTNFFSVVDSLTATETLDYANSLELPGRPRVYASADPSVMIIGDAETMTLTRYDLEDGVLVAGDSFSLQPFGVTSLGAQAVIFLSETKAYYKDNAQMQIIAFDPTAMEVTSEEPIKLPSELVKDGLRNGFSDWASRDGEVYFTVGWTSATYDRVEPGTVLVSIDPATDKVTTTAEPRCRGLKKTANVDGDLYFFSDVINALGYVTNSATDGGQKDCILRILKGEKTFDADYQGTMDGAFGDNHVGAVASVSADGEAWVTVADLDVTPSAPGTTYSEWYTKGWSWWHLPLATLTNAQRVEAEAGAFSSKTFSSGSNHFILTAQPDYGTSTFVDISSGTPTDGLVFSGYLLDVFEVR